MSYSIHNFLVTDREIPCMNIDIVNVKGTVIENPDLGNAIKKGHYVMILLVQ